MQLSEPTVALKSRNQPQHHSDESPAPRSFRLAWARAPHELAEAQRLRHRVFAGEMGARLRVPPGAPAGHDIDAFDPFCEHLLVRAIGTAQHDQVIATCRILSPDGARRAGSCYTDSEFDLTPVRGLLPRALEMGRVCVDAAWRNGLVVMAIWQELGQQLVQRGLDTVIGCSSVSLSDGGELAFRMWHDLKPVYLLPPIHQVRPWTPLQLMPVGADEPVRVPALIKGYLRCGGKLIGPPAHDEDFNTADFPMMLRLADMPARYGKRIIGA
ncbi:MAG: ornithine-acyl-ACP acyltransferase [Ramlibacter sp.]|nr:ornithine-acyl-ACP acyltransferase [Ramlibacter sp.]